jgi:hypothetical protein
MCIIELHIRILINALTLCDPFAHLGQCYADVSDAPLFFDVSSL